MIRGQRLSLSLSLSQLLLFFSLPWIPADDAMIYELVYKWFSQAGFGLFVCFLPAWFRRCRCLCLGLCLCLCLHLRHIYAWCSWWMMHSIETIDDTYTHEVRNGDMRYWYWYLDIPGHYPSFFFPFHILPFLTCLSLLPFGYMYLFFPYYELYYTYHYLSQWIFDLLYVYTSN